MCCLVHHFEIKASRVWSLRSDEGDFKYSVCVIPVNKAVKPYIHRAIDPDYYFCTPPPPPKTRTHTHTQNMKTITCQIIKPVVFL